MIARIMLRHHRSGLILLLLSVIPAYAAEDRLPFPDGTYAIEASYCAIDRDEALLKHEGAFIDIQGSKVTYYESFCEVRDVTEKAHAISFREICEAEGEVDVHKVIWRRLGPSGFMTEHKLRYTLCEAKEDTSSSRERAKVPIPRSKPLEVLMMAAKQMQAEPSGSDASILMGEQPESDYPETNSAPKSDFIERSVNGEFDGADDQQLVGDPAATLYWAGVRSFEGKNWKLASEYFDVFNRAFPSHPLSGPALLYLGQAESELGEQSRACSALERAERLEPVWSKQVATRLLFEHKCKPNIVDPARP